MTAPDEAVQIVRLIQDVVRATDGARSIVIAEAIEAVLREHYDLIPKGTLSEEWQIHFDSGEIYREETRAAAERVSMGVGKIERRQVTPWEAA